MVYNCFDIKASGGTTEKEIMKSEELAKELQKPIIRKFEKKRTFTFYKQYLGRRSCRYVVDK